jgi:predicted transcriptional regulator
MGQFSILYSITANSPARKAIADYFGVKGPVLTTWLHTLFGPLDKSQNILYLYIKGFNMATATINMTFDDEMIRQIDSIANNESLIRTDLIYNLVKMYINRKQRLQQLFACGERIAAQGNFTEEAVMEEINQYRKNK